MRAGVLRSMAVDDDAVHYVGEGSAGHFVKLVHNAIEFGMFQAIAEGYELLVRSEHDIDIAALFEHWNHGTVIRSWLIELMANALREGGVGPQADVPPDLDALDTYVEDTGEVKWVLEWALESDVPTPVVSAAQQMLMAYRERDWPAAKAIALLATSTAVTRSGDGRADRGWVGPTSEGRLAPSLPRGTVRD